MALACFNVYVLFLDRFLINAILKWKYCCRGISDPKQVYVIPTAIQNTPNIVFPSIQVHYMATCNGLRPPQSVQCCCEGSTDTPTERERERERERESGGGGGSVLKMQDF